MSDGFLKGITDGSNKCECHRCIDENNLTGQDILFGKEKPLSACKYILCGECGNKVKVKDSYPKRIKIGKQPAVTKAVCKSCFNK